MRNVHRFATLALVLGLCSGVAACDDDSVKGNAREAGDAIEDAADETVDEVEKAVDDINDG